MATNQAYKKANYDHILFRVKKGVNEQYTEWAAAAMGVGQMEMIRRAIDEYIANHGGEGVPTVAPVKPALTVEQRKILDATDSLPESSRKALLKFLQTLADAKPY